MSSPTNDSGLAPGPADLPPPWALRGATPPEAPSALARILRGLMLVPLLIGGFGLGVGVFGLQADFVWYIFVGLLGLLAAPIAYLEAALHARSMKARNLAAGSVLILVTGAAWLLFGQTAYVQEVLAGKDQASALRSCVDLMMSLSMWTLVSSFLPLSFPFAGSFWLELRGVRRRWHPFLLLICLPPAMILLGLIRAGRGNDNAFIVTIVLASSLLIPVANGLARAAASYWRERRTREA